MIFQCFYLYAAAREARRPMYYPQSCIPVGGTQSCGFGASLATLGGFPLPDAIYLFVAPAQIHGAAALRLENIKKP
jgi:hypothetical protein